MNCENFLPDLETGGWWRRRRALRHAARCPRCAKVHAGWLGVKARLARPAPLSKHARDLWHRATRESSVRPERRIRVVPLVACLTTAACVLIVFVGPALWTRRVPSVTSDPWDRQEMRIVSATSLIVVDPTEEFTELAAAIDRLDAELQSLQMTAQRLDAQRDVTVALNQYGKW